MAKEREELKAQSSQAAPSLARVELKVSGANCCDSCRRKVLKALSIKGVLRTELHSTADKVAVVGDVDGGRLVRRLAKVGKVAEVIVARPPEAEVGSKKPNGSSGGDDSKALPAARGSAHAGHGAGGGKCEPEGAHAAAAKNGVRVPDNGGGNGSAAGKGHREGGRAPAAFNGGSEATMLYDRAEPPMVVAVHLPYYAANLTMPPPLQQQQYGVGSCYYAMSPPPPHYAMPHPPPSHCRHPPVVRPQPTRFVDDDVFSDENTIGCHVM